MFRNGFSCFPFSRRGTSLVSRWGHFLWKENNCGCAEQAQGKSSLMGRQGICGDSVWLKDTIDTKQIPHHRILGMEVEAGSWQN